MNPGREFYLYTSPQLHRQCPQTAFQIFFQMLNSIRVAEKQ